MLESIDPALTLSPPSSQIRKTLLSVGDKKRSHSSIETQLEESIAKRRKTG